MPDCAECGKHYERVKNLESHRRAEHPTEAERRILVDGISPDPEGAEVIAIDRPTPLVDGLELVEGAEEGLDQVGFFNHPERAAERARLNREVAEKITSDQKTQIQAQVAAEEWAPVLTEAEWEESVQEQEEMEREPTLGSVVRRRPDAFIPPLAAVPDAVVQSHPSVPAPRRHLDYVKHRCWDGFPEPMDAKWLLARVEEADSLLRVLAQPHVLAEWNRSLSE